MKKDGIKIKGYRGRWHIIDYEFYFGSKYYLLEHSTLGDMTACLIVDESMNVVLDDVWNGWLDLV